MTKLRTTKSLIVLALLVLGVCGVNTLSASAQDKSHPDRVRATKIIHGSLVGFEFGDYLHATIKKSDGKEVSFFLMKPGLDYFLALHKGEALELTYQVVDTYIPEAGGMQKIERLISAKAGKLTFAVWWKNARAKSTMKQLQDKYDPLVQKATKP